METVIVVMKMKVNYFQILKNSSLFTFSISCLFTTGDCDSDSHCLPWLKCGTDNCGSSRDSGLDCCYHP